MNIEHELKFMDQELKKVENKAEANVHINDTTSIFFHIENIRQSMRNIDKRAKDLNDN